MIRLIDADKLWESIYFSKKENDVYDTTTITMKELYDIIDNAPTVEFDEDIIQQFLNKRCMSIVTNEYLIALQDKRPQGEWILGTPTEYYPEPNPICPFCNFGNDDTSNYCPNCGARLVKNDG